MVLITNKIQSMSGLLQQNMIRPQNVSISVQEVSSKLQSKGEVSDYSYMPLTNSIIRSTVFWLQR